MFKLRYVRIILMYIWSIRAMHQCHSHVWSPYIYIYIYIYGMLYILKIHHCFGVVRDYYSYIPIRKWKLLEQACFDWVPLGDKWLCQNKRWVLTSHLLLLRSAAALHRKDVFKKSLMMIYFSLDFLSAFI